MFGADDFESRSTFSYGFKLPYSLKLDCEQSLRLSGKEQSFKQTFTELTLSYEIIDDRVIVDLGKNIENIPHDITCIPYWFKVKVYYVLFNYF